MLISIRCCLSGTKYPVLGIAPASVFGCNWNMRLLYLFGGVMILSGCHNTRQWPPLVKNTPMPVADTMPEPRRIEPRATEAASSVTPPVVEGEDIAPADPNPPGLGARIAIVNARFQDAFYGYDRSDLTAAASAALQHDAKLLLELLTEFPRLKVSVEGHCDERGSAEYNLALGDSRARRASEALRDLGLQPARLENLSYGKEKPQCTDPSESCWQKNRRAHIEVSVNPTRPPGR